MEDLPSPYNINAIVFEMLSGCKLTAKIMYLANSFFKHIWVQEYHLSDFLFSLQKIIYHKTCLNTFFCSDYDCS